MVNLPAAEVILQKMYGLMQAVQKWRPKVRWGLLSE